MEYLNILVWISLAWACLHVLTFSRFSSKLPPGPFPLPIFGNIFKLGKMRHKSLAELAETYGPLMTLKLGSLITIVVSSANMAKEVLQKHDQHLSARTIPDVMRLFNNHETSLIWLPATHKWRNLRQICASQLFTTKRLNDSARIRLTKVMDLMDYVQDSSRSRRVINIGQIIFSTTLNMISNTMFSMDLTPLDSDSAHAQEYKAIVWETMEGIARPNIVDYFPLLRPFDPQGARRRATILFKKYDTIFETIIDKRIQSKEQGDSKDLLDTLLQLLTQENGSTLSHFDMKTLLKDLFVAGTDTSAGTLEWAMTELLLNPDIMAKVRSELKEKIGKDRPVEESDIARLPYLQAVVKESLRLHPPGPLLIPHRAETNVEICGFTVPKNAQVLINVWAINRDPAVWSKPTSFVPERFLESSIDFRGRDFEFIPFGAGRRMCPGLPLAYRMVHFILASLLHSFDWVLPDGMKPEDIDMEEKFGLSLQKAKPLYAIPIKA